MGDRRENGASCSLHFMLGTALQLIVLAISLTSQFIYSSHKKNFNTEYKQWIT
jgi:hypothetical protein